MTTNRQTFAGYEGVLTERGIDLYEARQCAPISCPEIWLKIFSYLEVQNLNQCAAVSKTFKKFAYDKALWQKLPINLAAKQVPIEFIQQTGTLQTLVLELIIVLFPNKCTTSLKLTSQLYFNR